MALGLREQLIKFLEDACNVPGIPINMKKEFTEAIAVLNKKDKSGQLMYATPNSNDPIQHVKNLIEKHTHKYLDKLSPEVIGQFTKLLPDFKLTPEPTKGITKSTKNR